MMVSEKKPVRVRFAPSPTGHFHLGGARAALFNWLFARQHGGEFVLRIEDTDTERSRKEFEAEILETLAWLGLDWDEGPDKGGTHGPYRQSERQEIYTRYLEKLLGENKAYYCYCTKDELDAERQAFEAEGLPPKYSGHCRDLEAPPSGKTPNVIRFKTPQSHVTFKDIVRGQVTVDASAFGDLVIARDVHSPLYNFAVVIDDREMEITHVIRGEDHISNTPKQILFMHALGFEEPLYAHIPLILGADRSKLSKRYAETSVLIYRERGYLPDALVNFLALLGWHPKDDNEILGRKELLEQFDLKRVQKAGAVFNEEKLDWTNAQYIKQLGLDDLASRLMPLLEKRGIKAAEDMIRKVALIERERMKTLDSFADLAGFFFALPEYSYELLPWKDDTPGATKKILEDMRVRLLDVPEKDFTEEGIRHAIEPLIDSHGRGSVLWPLRAALSGQKASPDPLQIAEILGKTETARRVEVAVEKLNLPFS